MAATSVPGTAAQNAPFLERVIGWTKRHRQATSWTATIAVIGAVLFVWTVSSNQRSEAIAGRQLQGARFAFDNQNLPLAASELQRIIENYSGTSAAGEARLVLAQVRLAQGQNDQAVQLLSEFAPGSSKPFRAQAYSLLGAAYENLGRPRDAAAAYEKGAEAARLEFMKAQLLSDAGRAWTAAGEKARAIAAYRQIVDKMPKAGVVTEAKVRLGELTKGTP